MSRRVRRRLRAAHDGDLVPLRVHALHVRCVVALLDRGVRSVGAARTHGRPAKNTDTRPDGGACSRTACSGAERSASGGTDQRPDRGATYGALRRRPVRGRPCLLERPLFADSIITLELFEALAIARQDHDGRSGGDRGTGSQEQCGADGNDCGSGHGHHRGATFIHGSLQDCTFG